MPRKDPMTGVMVMTTEEFFAAEARRNGTSAADEMESFLDEMSQMVAEDEANMRKLVADPVEALKMLLEGLRLSNECAEPEYVIKAPTQVIETFDFEFSEGMKQSSLKFKARVDDGRVLEYSSWHHAGSYWEPPEGETIVEEVQQ